MKVSLVLSFALPQLCFVAVCSFCWTRLPTFWSVSTATAVSLSNVQLAIKSHKVKMSFGWHFVLSKQNICSLRCRESFARHYLTYLWLLGLHVYSAILPFRSAHQNLNHGTSHPHGALPTSLVPAVSTQSVAPAAAAAAVAAQLTLQNPLLSQQVSRIDAPLYLADLGISSALTEHPRLDLLPATLM